MSEANEMKPCPFCGPNDLLAVSGRDSLHKNRREYFVTCAGCHMRGPWDVKEYRSVLAWNDRIQSEEKDKHIAELTAENEQVTAHDLIEFCAIKQDEYRKKNNIIAAMEFCSIMAAIQEAVALRQASKGEANE